MQILWGQVKKTLSCRNFDTTDFKMSVMKISRPLSHHGLTKDASAHRRIRRGEQIKIFFHTSPRFFLQTHFSG